MKRIHAAVAAAALSAAAALFVAMPGSAALPVGAKAPDFAAEATLAGKPFPFRLAQALRKGPVVLYFYPKAFTGGCTIEAHEFAEASDEFNRLGATVIGISADDIETLNKFSVSECRNKFAVAAATPEVIADYDVKLPVGPKSNRTSFVIAPDGKIVYVYSALGPAGHVSGAMEAVKAYAAAHPKR